MRQKLHKILVTGGAGFIGSEFVRQGVKKGYRIIVVDKITYAGDLERLRETEGKFIFYKVDICDRIQIDKIFSKEKPSVVVHFAAESHVDRSIHGFPLSFTETNVKGTQVLLDASRKYGINKFIHISTDEVYGDIKRGKFSEDSRLNPSSPYSASKAAADYLVKSYIRTYKLPAIIIRPSNNYDPWQYPEKFIPVVIYNSLIDKYIPIYAKGLNKREWLHVSDCVNAIFLVLRRGRTGEIYNIGSGDEKRNIDVAYKILALLNKPKTLLKFVKDRPGHDYRYALNISRINKFGWKPVMSFDDGIANTVSWYRQNFGWLRKKINSLGRFNKKFVYQ